MFKKNVIVNSMLFNATEDIVPVVMQRVLAINSHIHALIYELFYYYFIRKGCSRAKLSKCSSGMENIDYNRYKISRYYIKLGSDFRGQLF